MKIEENKIYKTKDNMYIHIKEITRINDDRKDIYAIVTSGICRYESDSKTTIERDIYTEKGFRDLMAENQEEFIN